MSEDDDFAPVAPAPYSFKNLVGEVARLQAELARLKAAVEGGASSLDPETFRALTGFHDDAVARKEYELAGGDAAFGQIDRHGTHLSAEVVHQAYQQMLQQYPAATAELKRAFETVFARRVAVGDHEKDARGRHAVVSNYHLFLLVFMYVHGGVLEFNAPFLPGIGVSESQFSRLLMNSTPVVASQWAARYYCTRGLQWLLQNAGPDAEVTKDQATRIFDENFTAADIVLGMDGGTIRSERSHGSVEQKSMFDWSKDNQNEVRVLVLHALSGVIVEVTTAAGGRTFEVEIAESLDIMDRLNDEALELEKHVRLHFVVDRGFDDFRKWLETQHWEHLTVTVGMPAFMNPHITRAEENAGVVRPPKRHFFTSLEAYESREIARERWISEWDIRALKRARFCHRLLDLTILEKIDDFLAIEAGLVNFGLDVEPTDV